MSAKSALASVVQVFLLKCRRDFEGNEYENMMMKRSFKLSTKKKMLKLAYVGFFIGAKFDLARIGTSA